MKPPVIPGLLLAAAALLALPSSSSAARVPTVFDPADFTPGQAIDNPYWPLVPGTDQVYTSEAPDGCEVELFTVTNDTKSDFPPPYDSVVARVISDRTWVDPDCNGNYALIETTHDWYAQDDFGNVWYFGEATTAYDDPSDCPTSAGSWEAGVGGATPGIVMLADPSSGLAYDQELLAGVAEDKARVLRTNARVSTPLGSFTDCVVTKEWSPLEHGAIEHKFYCPQGGGLVLIKELQGGTVRSELVGDTLPPGTYASVGVCGGG